MFGSMQQSKIKVQSMPLQDLLSNLAQGNLQMPRFQREFVWPVSKTRDLLDSMYKEFPIGTLFFWQAPADQHDIMREMKELGIPAPQPHQPISFILDGQQRLTSLYAAGNGLKLGSKDYSNIRLDLAAALEYEGNKSGFEGKLFASPRSSDPQRYVPFQDILTMNFETYNALPDEYKAIYQTAQNRFTTYPFSVVLVREQPLNEVVEIFQRINQGGKKLSSYDLVCANLWSTEFNFREKVKTLNKQLAESFGKIDEKIVPQALALILEGKSSQSVQLRLKSDAVEAIWQDVHKALLRAVDFLRSNVGVVRSEFLPYAAILSLLTMFFYELKGKALSAEHRRALWEWFWITSASEAYAVASREKINQDGLRLQQLLKGEAVDWAKRQPFSAEALLQVKMGSTTSALRNTVLCLLALQQPRNFKDGSTINLSHDFFSTLSRAERHHIFPVAYLKKQGVNAKDVHWLPNFVFIPGELNKEISDKAPSVYMTQYQNENPGFSADVRSHLVPIGQDSPLWNDNYREFLRSRAELITATLNQLLQTGPRSDEMKSEPAEAHPLIESVELQLRDVIDAQLSAVGGQEYWDNAVPQHVQNRVNQKIGQHLKAHPYLSAGKFVIGRNQLDFCDVGNYVSIIKHNWSQFQPVFHNQDKLLRHLEDFRTYRNYVAHNNQGVMTDTARLNGEAAALWLQDAMQSYQSEESQPED